MEQSSESRGGSDLANDIDGEQSERHSEPVTAKADEDDRQVDEQESDDCRDDTGDQYQGRGDNSFNEVGYTSTVEEEAGMLETAAVDPDQDVNAGGEQDSHKRKQTEIEEVMAKKPGADSLVENEAAGEGTADARSPSGERNAQPVREKKLSKSSESETPAGLPVTRVKRIIKLDPDIRLVSKEGIFAIIHATQHFLEALASESISQAWKSKRKGVKADDIVVAARNPMFRDCLGTTLSDYVQHLREEERDREDGESADESEREEIAAASKKGNKRDAKRKCLQPPPGNRSITDFLKVAG